jgi:hypothetical protein
MGRKKYYSVQIGISVFYPHEEEFYGDFKNAAQGVYIFDLVQI